MGASKPLNFQYPMTIFGIVAQLIAVDERQSWERRRSTLPVALPRSDENECERSHSWGKSAPKVNLCSCQCDPSE